MKTIIIRPMLAKLLISAFDTDEKKWTEFLSNAVGLPLELPNFCAEIKMPIRCNLMVERITLKVMSKNSFLRSKKNFQSDLIYLLKKKVA